MLIKEYRIPLPLTVEEYRIAQLYMIAKKSREESSGAGSGVEILINEPYEDGPGGKGQYTRKIYHVGSHLPGWLKGILPKTALMVEEEAWNAYPYTKTRYTCPFVEKFYLEIETFYFADNGHQENVFQLTGSDLRNRIIDTIDVVRDQLYGTDYVKEEDPKIYHSDKSGRGPLGDTWLEDYWNEIQGNDQPLPNGKCIMCAYKLCKVEFRYWGMQTKIEKFIHDVALRKTMLRAHRQAWAWQDEWHGLTMEDIREIERQTQLALKRKMGQVDDEDDNDTHLSNGTYPKDHAAKNLAATLESIEKKEDSPVLSKSSNSLHHSPARESDTDGNDPNPHLKITNRSDDKWHQPVGLHSPGSTSIKSFDIHVANWRIESLGRDSDSGSDEEFFDCVAKWSSLDLLTEDDDAASPTYSQDKNDDSIFSSSFLQRVASERGSKRLLQRGKVNSLDTGCPDSPGASPAHLPCSTTVLLLVFHGGSVLDVNTDMLAKKSDVTTFRGAFESVMRQHYPMLIGHIVIKLVSCPSICTEGLGILSSLSPYSFDISPMCSDVPQVTHDSIPIGAVPLLATSTPDYQENITKTINGANIVYQEFLRSDEGRGFTGQVCVSSIIPVCSEEFLRSDEGRGFTGQVCVVADSIGSILAYDAMCRTTKYQSRHGSENSILDQDPISFRDNVQINDTGLLIAPSPRRRSSSTSEATHATDPVRI
ncbi:Phosphatidylinositol transfer protein [Popillia japonica]|uniref:Phosphatidylinositol transfer protein n=1 Tax=Popillia japonica TaxID=7064 RepID=A0AAW1J0H8_POPJA